VIDEVCARLSLAGRVLRPAMVRVRGETWPHRENGSKRTTTRCSGWRRPPPTRRSPAPTGSWRSSITLTPTPAPRTLQEISAAYDVLGDADRRKEYDEVRRLGPWRGFGTPGGFGGGDPPTSGSRTSAIWGTSSAHLRRPGGRRRARGPQRGADLETELHLSFEDAVRGATVAVNLPVDSRCHTCGGSGRLRDRHAHLRPLWRSRDPRRQQGLFSLSTVCPKCNGRGTLVDTPCPTCHGTGTERRNRQVKVRIPAGVEDGQRIRVKGKGAPARHGAGRRPLCRGRRRQARGVRPARPQPAHLVPVTFPEAALGTR